MSRLTVGEAATGREVLRTEDAGNIARALSPIGVRFERWDARCAQGDLISVPAHTRHWFDARTAPHFTALRVFLDSAGWAPHDTGSDIANRFPVTI